MADYSKSFQVEYSDAGDACTIRFRCFDTPNSVTTHQCAEGFDAEGVLLAVRGLCLDYHFLWSFSLAGSDVARLNAPETRIAVDRRTVRILEAMKRFNASEPAFDFTVGPLSYLWKHAEKLPTDAELAQARSLVGAGKVSLDGEAVVKADPRMQIDIGGAAKGFIADEIAALLRSSGVTSADIDLGGNLFMLGSHPAGRPWRVAVRVPEGIEAQPPLIEVEDASVVTSGSYERFVEIDGVRYHHIINAQTGWPSETDIVSVTVVSESSLTADMLATTALMAGTAGLEGLKRRHPDERFIAIVETGEVIDL